MSGRKSSEVAQVLKSSQQGRGMTLDTVNAEIGKTSAYIANVLASNDEIKGQAARIVAQPCAESEKYFPDRSRNLASAMRDLRRRIDSGGPAGNGMADINRDFEQIQARLQACDNQAEAIRKAIANKRNGWYCDEEYRQAQNLGASYQQVFSSFMDLLDRAARLRSACEQEHNDLNAALQKLQSLARDVAAMNETAARRQRGDELRGQLDAAFAALDGQFSQKFFASEHEQLGRDIAAAKALDDAELIAAFAPIYDNILAYSQKLAERIAQWRQMKADAEGRLATLKDQAALELIGPVEFFNKGEKGKKEALFAFLEHYGGQSRKAAYEQLLADIGKALAAEDFAGCGPLLDEAMAIIAQSRAEALRLRESMLNKTYLAAELQRAMRSLGYDTKLGLFDGNPNSGYRLECRTGNEEIDFEHIDINGDGSIVMDIDHKAASGCGPTWTTIANRLRQNGIPVTDVRLANGDSVICQAAKAKTREQGVRQRG